MARRRLHRLPSTLYVGRQRYSLTICCEGREPSFDESMAREIVLRQLRCSSEKHEFTIVAYCLMPDHVHVIAEGQSDQSDCLEFIRVFKQRSGFEWRRCGREQLWQGSFYDHILRSDESTQRAVRYVLENPVRAKIVTEPADYAHSGSFVYDRKELIEWAFEVRV